MPKKHNLSSLDEYTSQPELLDQVVEPSTPIVLEGPVRNTHPTLTFPYRLAIIGEAPGADEIHQKEPFVGMSGRFLTQLLSKAGIVRTACFIGNVCQYRPYGNDITNFSREGREIKEGLALLQNDLAQFNPHCCLLLGKTALWAAKGTDAIGDWRGSFFISDIAGPFLGRKCIASYHPAACLRMYDWTPLLMFDIKKAFEESTQPGLILPQRDLWVPECRATAVNEILERLLNIKGSKPTIAIDIEGYVNDLKCISIAPTGQSAFIVPFSNFDKSNYYENVEDELQVWQALISILSDPSIPKVLQNSLYDRFVLQYSYNLVVRGVIDDTMLKHWELYCELEKSLGFQCSIYTKEPYYKFQRKAESRENFWRYCCRDSAVTWEINSKLAAWVTGESNRHYQFNMALLNPLLYMELRGIKYDSNLAAERLEGVNQHIYTLQYELDTLSSFGIRTLLPETPKEDVLDLVTQVMYYKRDSNQPKSAYVEDYPRAKELAERWENTSMAEKGELAVLCGVSLNIKSDAFKKYVYETLNCPKQYKTDPKTKKERLTTDYEALLKILKVTNLRQIDLAIQIGSLRTRAQMLAIHADNDGRIRCGYNIVGTETGRITCYTSPTGSGYNLQTIPDENTLKEVGHPLRQGMRDLFVSDPGCYLFQCDLSGADGWTVAAYLASLGDPTMLEDYRAGIKPAKVMCYLLRHGAASLDGKTRGEILELTKEVKKDSWDYFSCKIGQHMTSYRGGPDKLSNVILMQSEGKVVMNRKETKDLQALLHVRYRVKLWWDWAERMFAKMSYPPKTTSPSGHTRRFFARKEDVVQQFLAHLPQSITTYATNLAMYKLWTDPENRLIHNSVTRLVVEPIHQVHDALMGQFKMDATDWAISKIKQWFNNPITINGIQLVIPFEGNYGTNWAMDERSKVGNI